ncbi:MAG: hypothetical protein M0D57_13775 [Sphingobacteriales bacterium JAD_PAG50586_3]|nr:MAG: hypothetical protein M0D57_13775 [Sphingobacteriales bacterium JAD_PAG50586_3]
MSYSSIAGFFLIIFLNSYAKGQSFTSENFNTSNSGIPDNTIYGISSYPLDSTNTSKIWVATYNGLAYTDGTNWTIYNTTDGLPDNSIRSVLVTPDSTVWAGTFTGGLAKINSNSITIYNTSNSNLPDNFVKALAYEAPSTLWIGTTGGLAKLQNDSITAYDLSDLGIHSTHVTSVAVSKEGIKIIGLLNGGFAYYNDTTFTFFTSANSGLLDNNILCVALDNESNPYMTTPAAGIVSHFGGNTFQMYFQGTIPDMPTNSFKCIERSPNGFLAGSIDKGLFIKQGVSSFTNNISWIGDTPDSNILGIHVLPISFKSSEIYAFVGSQNSGLYALSPATTSLNETYFDKGVTATIENNYLYLKSVNEFKMIHLYTTDGKVITSQMASGNSISIIMNNLSPGFVIAYCQTTKGFLLRNYL